LGPVFGVRILPDQPYAKAFRIRPFQLKVGFVNSEGNWAASDRERTVLLRVDPVSGGTLSRSELVFPKGAGFSQVTYVPYQEGTATVIPVIPAASGLTAAPAKIEFDYSLPWFFTIAAAGGLLSGVVRQYFRKKYAWWRYLLSAAGGAFLGFILFFVVRYVVTINFKPDANLSNSIEAVVL